MTSKDVYGQKKIKDIGFTSKNFPFDCITLSKDPEPEVSGQRNIIWRFLVADDTGSMMMKIWGEQGESISEGDILHLHDAEIRQYLGLPYITLSRSGHLQRVGRDIFLYNDKPNRSEVLRDSNQQSMPQTGQNYGQQQKYNSGGRSMGGKKAAINPARMPQNQTPPSMSGPFNSYQGNQHQQGSSMPVTPGEPSMRGGFDRGGRGGKRGRGRGRFRDRDQPDRNSPAIDRSFNHPDSDSQMTPMKREFDDPNASARQRNRVKYDKV